MFRIPAYQLASVLAAILALAPCARAQEQETEMQRRLSERLAPDPNTTLEFVPRTGSGKPLVKPFDAPSARIKPFAFQKKFNIKGFSTTEFRSKAYEAKSFTGNDKQYATEDALANWRASANPNGMVRDAAGVKGYEVAEARESSTDVPQNVAPREYASKPAAMRGKSQADLDREYNEAPALNIDQVRELLNKNE